MQNRDLMEPTPFQAVVYEATRRIPRGRVTTYKTLADAIGCRSPRAVGQALKRNPFAPEVPCHRVIASGLTLGGFRGTRSGTALHDKEHLLRQEGVCFTHGILTNPDLFWCEF